MALLVAILVSVVLLGLGAVVLNSGSWFAERAQLQNGADASAFAVAQSCASGACDVTLAGNDTTVGEADNNANDKLANVDTVCGNSSAAPGLTPCTAQQADGTYCPKDPGYGTGWVNVHTSTKTSSGTAIPVLGKLDGKPVNVKTCAQAAWGPTGGGTGLALTMSICAWQEDTDGGTYATPAPPYPASGWPTGYTATVSKQSPVVPNPGGENVVEVHGSAKPCNDSPSGLNVPGGFGWLSDNVQGQQPANCVVQTDVNGFIYQQNGGLGGKQSECANALQDIYNAGTPIPNDANPIFIPVFDAACGSDGMLQPDDNVPCTSKYPGMPTGSYHIAGYATFVLTGYDVSPISAKSMITGKGACSGNFDCLYGMFTTGLIDPEGTICKKDCGTDFGGPVAVQMTG